MEPRTGITRDPVAVFLVVTVGLSILACLVPVSDQGAVVGILLLVAVLPAVVAIAVTWSVEGRGGATAFLRQCFQWRSPLVWYLVAIGLGFGMQFGASVLALATGSLSGLQLNSPDPLLIVFILFALLEEIGWRGFALRRLLVRYSPFTSTLVVGGCWGLIHFVIALLLLSDRAPISEGISVFAAAFPLTWVFVRSGGSVLVATVLHFVYNASGSVAGPSFAVSIEDAIWFLAASSVIFAILVVLIDRRRWFASPAETAIAPPVLGRAGGASEAD